MTDSQNRLKNSIIRGTSKEEKMDPYVKFRTRFYQKYDIQTWCEMPGKGTCEEMFSIFRKHCAEPVLDNLGCRIKSTIVPSHVLNKLDDEFYNLLNMYMKFLTRAPLTLVQLCRMVLSRQGSQELISLFKDIKSSSLREQLFHMTQDKE